MLCILEGKTIGQNLKTYRTRRMFDGDGDIIKNARACLAKRSDEGYPWYGDAVVATTPSGQRITVEIPWPERQE